MNHTLKTRKGKRYAIREGHFSKVLFQQWQKKEAERIHRELLRKAQANKLL